MNDGGIVAFGWLQLRPCSGLCLGRMNKNCTFHLFTFHFSLFQNTVFAISMMFSALPIG